MPTPCWLALQAIRFVARATAYDIPFRLMVLRQTPYSGLAVAVVTNIDMYRSRFLFDAVNFHL